MGAEACDLRRICRCARKDELVRPRSAQGIYSQREGRAFGRRSVALAGLLSSRVVGRVAVVLLQHEAAGEQGGLRSKEALLRGRQRQRLGGGAACEPPLPVTTTTPRARQAGRHGQSRRATATSNGSVACSRRTWRRWAGRGRWEARTRRGDSATHATHARHALLVDHHADSITLASGEARGLRHGLRGRGLGVDLPSGPVSGRWSRGRRRAAAPAPPSPRLARVLREDHRGPGPVLALLNLPC